jgi:Integrase core domain
MILHVLIAMVAGWIQRHQRQVITYLEEENRLLKAQLGGRRLRLTHTERRRLAALALSLGLTRLQEVAAIATPETLCERFVRSIKEEALHQMIVIGEASLRYVLQSYLAHYHQERNHQGLNNQLMTPEPGVGRQSGGVVCRERLGGLLTYDYREAA